MTRRRLGLLAALAALALPAVAEAAAPRVLVYSGTAGFRHMSIEAGKQTLSQLAAGSSGRFAVEHVDRPDQLTKERLAASDAVLWLSTTGTESPFTDEQQGWYERWVGCGGGHIGVHASTDSYRDWPVWAELTGAFFASHPVTPTSAADDQTPAEEGWGEPEARVLVRDSTSPTTAPWHGRDAFLHRDEYYALDRDPGRTIRDFRATLAFGGFTDPLVALAFGSMYAPEQPLAWTGSFRGKNRLAYTNLGHAVRTWAQSDFRASLVGTIEWVAGVRPGDACLVEAGLKPAPPKAVAKKKAKSEKKPKAKRKTKAKRKPAAGKRTKRPAGKRPRR